MESHLLNRLLSLIQSSHLPLDLSQSAQLLTYIRLLHEGNQRFNLTGFKSEHTIFDEVICESLPFLLLPELLKKDLTIIDVGSGAGIPGIPLLIMFHGLTLTFIESHQKKCHFIQNSLHLLQLDTRGTVICDRAEKAGQNFSLRNRFNVGVCRALSNVTVDLELVSPFVQIGGLIILIKGPRLFEEIKHAQAALRMLECIMNTIIVLPIPGSERLNYYAVFQKIADTPIQYPRKVGIPQKRPLGNR